MRLLNDLSYFLGIIGLAEYAERSEIEEWLSDENENTPDPRGFPKNIAEWPARENCGESDVFLPFGDTDSTSIEDPRWMKFLVLKKWHFTISDPDCVPSVPHGHENAKTQSWPKLNP